MPDEPNPNAGTGEQPNPQPGTGADAAAVQSQPPPADQTVEYWKQRYAASTAEAQRLYQENLALKQAQQKPQEQQHEDIYAQLTDYVLDRDKQGIQKFARQIVSEATSAVKSELTAEQRRQARIAASMSVVNPVFANPQNPVAVEAIRRYQEIVSDPAYSYVADDSISINTLHGEVRLNPHLLRQAVLEAQVKLGSRISAADSALNAEAPSLEPTRGSATPSTNSATFSPQRHLTEAERSYCDERGIPYERYWKYMEPTIKEARLKAGKPVTRRDIIK